MKRFFTILLLLVPCALSTGQEPYRKPPRAVLDVLDAPLPATVFLSPAQNRIVLAQPMSYPAISDLAAPVLKLAGVRVNPRTNNERSYLIYWTKLTVKDLASGKETPVILPASVKRIGRVRWNATGDMFAFTSETDSAVDLWVCDAARAYAWQVRDARINPVLGAGVQWMPDQKSLIVKLIPSGRGAPPAPPAAPAGPRLMESFGAAVASSTYEALDLLKTPYDADLFDYYTISQLALVKLPSCEIIPLGAPAVYGNVQTSPDGRYLMLERIHRPYSYQRACYRFPCEIELWSADGQLHETLASQPLAEAVPIDGEITGPREHFWRATAPATVVWIEALDNGDPEAKVPFRDQVMQKPVGGAAAVICKTQHRCARLEWIENSSQALVHEYDRDRRRVRAMLRDADNPAAEPRQLWEHSIHERFKRPGSPVTRVLPNGAVAIRKQGNSIYFKDEGFIPNGQRPFLDRMDLGTLASERLFRSAGDCYEYFVDWVDPAKGTFVTRRETQNTPPNLFLRTLARQPLKNAPGGEAAWKSASRALTHFPDPTPQLRGITKKIITYTRADSLQLSFTLYLPPGYKEGTRLPTLLWAYPGDIAEKEVAGQVSGTSQHFTTFRGVDQLFFLLAGYAVLDNAAMPVIGPPATVYDGFIDQICANAKAAVDKAVEIGVTDPQRVGVGGHSHGGLMTANLLAYTGIFRAGIAMSGAYNHTLRPFGYQNEKRTLWQARDTYIRNSPLLQADKIDEPLLLIHGEVDANPGTVPVQSEKLYDAVRGTGGTVKLVMLPHESHSYNARESVEHALYEMLAWFDRYVKNAPPRPPLKSGEDRQ